MGRRAVTEVYFFFRPFLPFSFAPQICESFFFFDILKVWMLNFRPLLKFCGVWGIVLTGVVLTLFPAAKDARFLVPIISGLSRSELVRILPKLVALPQEHARNAMSKIFATHQMSPSDLLVQLHGLCPSKKHPLLRKVRTRVRSTPHGPKRFLAVQQVCPPWSNSGYNSILAAGVGSLIILFYLPVPEKIKIV